MGKDTRAKKTELLLTVDPIFPGKVLLSPSEPKESGVLLDKDNVQPIRYRRRTTSFKAKRPSERRASLPPLNRYKTKPKSTKKSMLQRIGSRLAKIGDDLLKRGCKAGRLPKKFSTTLPKSADKQRIDMKEYASRLAEIGDCLNDLYSDDVLMYAENRYSSLAEKCLFLTSILIGLKNNNVVLVNESDLDILSSFCQIHRVKSISTKTTR